MRDIPEDRGLVGARRQVIAMKVSELQHARGEDTTEALQPGRLHGHGTVDTSKMRGDRSMCLTLRSHVEPKIARLSSSYVQSSGYVLLGSRITVVPSHQALPLAQAPPWRRYGMGLALFPNEEPITANSYDETSTGRHGQRCPPTPPATRAPIFWG
jgi:hypothetical protein